MNAPPSRRLTWMVLLLAVLATCAALAPFLFTAGPGPTHHTSVRGEDVLLHGYGPYRHMPAEVAVQGLAQDAVTLAIGVPFLLAALMWARSGSRAGHLALCGAVGYLLVQYFMYLGMATFNELFLVWTALLLVASQTLARLLLDVTPTQFEVAGDPRWSRLFVGGFLLVNGGMMALLWLSVVLPPLVSGELYPAGLAHLTTMFVQGFDLALFLPPSFLAGYAYLRRRAPGDLLAPAYAVFLTLQMIALLAKIIGMSAVGAGGGPALVVIPLLLVGAAAAAVLGLRPHHGARLA